MTNLIPYNSANVSVIINGIIEGEYKLELPPVNGPHELNEINLAAKAILRAALDDLTPYELSFVANMGKVNGVTKKQRKWLCDLFKKHVGYELDGVGGDPQDVPENVVPITKKETKKGKKKAA